VHLARLLPDLHQEIEQPDRVGVALGGGALQPVVSALQALRRAAALGIEIGKHGLGVGVTPCAAVSNQ